MENMQANMDKTTGKLYTMYFFPEASAWLELRLVNSVFNPLIFCPTDRMNE